MERKGEWIWDVEHLQVKIGSDIQQAEDTRLYDKAWSRQV